MYLNIFTHSSVNGHLFIHVLMMAILTSVRWLLIIVLICIFIIIGNAEHLFHASSLEKCLFSFSAHFSTGCLLLLSCMSCLKIKPLSGTLFANIP